MWAVMIESMPSSTAAANGGSSTASHSSRVWSITGMPVWLSTAVSPWPGKCLAVAETPAAPGCS